MYSRPKWRSIPRTLSLSPTIEVSTSNDVWGGKVQACVDPFASGPRRDPRPPLPLRSPEGVFFFFFFQPPEPRPLSRWHVALPVAHFRRYVGPSPFHASPPSKESRAECSNRCASLACASYYCDMQGRFCLMHLSAPTWCCPRLRPNKVSGVPYGRTEPALFYISYLTFLRVRVNQCAVLFSGAIIEPLCHFVIF